MPTKNSELLPTGTLYLQDKDGNMTPFMSLAEAALHGCTGGTINFVDDIPVIQEMTFEVYRPMPLKRATRAVLRAAGYRTKRKWSRKALERPMRRIKRQKEKARRYTIKNGIDKKIIAHFKKYMEEHKDEEFSH